jgi:hypothetical protein
MTTNGILLHVYHLEADRWEDLVWGHPSADTFGTLTQFAYTLLRIPANQQVRSVIYSGPSSKDGLSEGGYTKRFLLDRIDNLSSFPTLRKCIKQLSGDEYDLFVRRIRGLVVGPEISNTLDEVTHAAAFLNENGPVDKVFQIAAASHAPRCLQNQLIARQKNLISPNQPWYIVASGVCFAGTTMDDIVILEPPHRGDDPMVGHPQTMARAIKPYFGMNAEGKQRLIAVVQNAISQQKS